MPFMIWNIIIRLQQQQRQQQQQQRNNNSNSNNAFTSGHLHDNNLMFLNIDSKNNKGIRIIKHTQLQHLKKQ